MDTETKIVTEEGQAFLDLIQSKGWGLAKETIITPFLLDMQSVNNIKHGTTTDIAREVYARQIAVEYVVNMLKDIEGRGEQHKNNAELTKEVIQIV